MLSIDLTLQPAKHILYAILSLIKQLNMFNNTPENAVLSALGSSPVPLYVKIKRLILQKINSGEWPAHFRIPSENELTQLLGASRMTISRALRELTAQGVLMRMQGVGTFVSESKGESALMAVRDVADEIKSRGHEHKMEMFVLEKIQATQELALMFDFHKKQPLFHSISVHYENGVPVQLVDRYVNAIVVSDYMEQDFTKQTPSAYLTQAIPLTQGQHVVEAVRATKEECARLQIEESEPCLQIRRKTWVDQTVITSARLLYPGSRYRLEGFFHS